MAHLLNLVVTDVFKKNASLYSILKKVHRIINDYVDLRRRTDLKLKQDVITRWNSSFYMLERFVEVANDVSAVLLESSSSIEMLSVTELRTAKEYVKILRPFELGTREMNAEKYITASKVIPVITMIEKAINKVETTTLLGRSLKSELILSLEERFEKVKKDSTLVIATPLDPRFKNVHCTNDATFEVAKNTIAALLPDKLDENDCDEENIHDEDENDSFWAHHDELTEKQKPSNLQMDDFTAYLNNPLISRKENSIWKRHHNKNSCKIALKYLTILAKSVLSGCLFSTTGGILTERRNRLNPKMYKIIFFQIHRTKSIGICYDLFCKIISRL